LECNFRLFGFGNLGTANHGEITSTKKLTTRYVADICKRVRQDSVVYYWLVLIGFYFGKIAYRERVGVGLVRAVLTEWAMLVPDLHFAVHCFLRILVQKKTVSMYLHMHIPSVSTWRHVGRVHKIANCTPKQTLKNVANPKSSRPHLPSCADSKTATCT
jgi:hypothetical protein